jgi:hypothetical protein
MRWKSITLRDYPRLEDNVVHFIFNSYLIHSIILESRIILIARSQVNVILDKYSRIEDNTVILKFDYFLIYCIIPNYRITISNRSLITRIIKLFLSTLLIANETIL